MRRTLWPLLLAFLGAVLISGVLTGEARAISFAPYSDFVGVSGQQFYRSEAESLNDYRRLRGAGIRWERETFRWYAIERERGRYDWAPTDALMSAASRNGVKVLAVVTGSPPWTSADPSPAHRLQYAPRDFDAYARFAAAVVRRYGPRGSFWRTRGISSPVPLAGVELWNEPYCQCFWKPQPDPGAYGALATRAAEAIRATRVPVEILVSGDLNQNRSDTYKPVSWLDNLLTSARRLSTLATAYSVHPYPNPPNEGTLGAVPLGMQFSFQRFFLSNEVALQRGAALPLWITEIGWSGSINNPRGVGEPLQAELDQDAIVFAHDAWGADVQRVFVHEWKRGTDDREAYLGNFALWRSDGRVKPAWRALSRLTRRPTP